MNEVTIVYAYTGDRCDYREWRVGAYIDPIQAEQMAGRCREFAEAHGFAPRGYLGVAPPGPAAAGDEWRAWREKTWATGPDRSDRAWDDGPVEYGTYAVPMLDVHEVTDADLAAAAGDPAGD